jgi:NAD(P)-dependent dehydrogenase (short-subunit alcohol dehydrogenase family)
MTSSDPAAAPAAGTDGTITSPVVVVGAGPGIGMAVARRFGAAGHPAGLIARDGERLESHVAELRNAGILAAAATADARRPDQLRTALRKLRQAFGAAQVLCFSPFPDTSLIKPVADTAAEDIGAALALNVVGAAAAVGELLPTLRPGATLLFTTGGAAVSPNPDRAVSAVAYSAEITYARLLHDALAPEIHVGVTTIVGAVGPGKQHEPAAVAEHLFRHHTARSEFHQVIR